MKSEKPKLFALRRLSGLLRLIEQQGAYKPLASLFSRFQQCIQADYEQECRDQQKHIGYVQPSLLDVSVTSEGTQTVE